MDRSEQLQQVFAASQLPRLLSVRAALYYPPPKDFTALRFLPNNFRIRALEMWDKPNPADSWFRIYHGAQIAPELKHLIDGLDGFRRKTSTTHYSDFFGDPQLIATTLGNLLADANVAEIVRSNPVVTRNSAYEGLVLPDVDVTDVGVLGRTFTWKELIAIGEDDSEENELRKVLSQPGVYLQRSADGKSRYVGSAYGDGGILGRWLRHLTANGSAKHLNIYVLENGYAKVLFTVLEFTDDAIPAESRWKETLGTRNAGPYDGFRLNSN
jgi:hypothetical protein